MWPFPRALERWYDGLVADLSERREDDLSDAPAEGLSSDSGTPLSGEHDDC